MQNKYDWSGYTTQIRKRSFIITFFLHIVPIFFILLLSGRKVSLKDEVFIVQMVEIPPVKIIKRTIPEKKEISEIKKMGGEKKFKKREIEEPAFSMEEYKKRLEKKLNFPVKKEEISKIKNIPIKIPEIKSTSLNIKNLQLSLTIPQWYILMVKSEIRKNWILKENFAGLSAIVSFRVDKNGKIENISLEKSSGFTPFDNSVIEAVKLTKDLPPFPEEINQNYLDIVIEFKTEG